METPTNTYVIPPKMAIINDISGFGRCSLTVALPVVSAMGIQGCPVPTSCFSNHMGYPSYFSRDLSEDLPAYLRQWNALDLTFDSIYCGYLHSISEIDTILTFISEQKKKNPNCMVLIDPVMGDHGIPYQSLTEEYFAHMRTLISYGDVITPNLTEACILAECEFSPVQTQESLTTLASTIRALGANKIVITGIPNNGEIANFLYESEDNYSLFSQQIAGESRPGTGDLFASIVAAEYMKSQNFTMSVKKASTFVSLCTQASHDLKIPLQDGVCFENFLSDL